MSDERGPADEFEVTWRSGHVDRLAAHQISWPGSMDRIFGDTGGPSRPPRVQFHAEVGGRWTLILDALEDDLLSIRNVTRIADGLL